MPYSQDVSFSGVVDSGLPDEPETVSLGHSGEGSRVGHYCTVACRPAISPLPATAGPQTTSSTSGRLVVNKKLPSYISTLNIRATKTILNCHQSLNPSNKLGHDLNY